MSTEGNRFQRRQIVADVASKLFGVEIKASNVIDETLERSINRSEPTIEELRESINKGLPAESEQTLENFQKHPLSYWIEMNFGLKAEAVDNIINLSSTNLSSTNLSSTNLSPTNSSPKSYGKIAAEGKDSKYNTRKSVNYTRRTSITLQEGAEKLARISALAALDEDALKSYCEQCLNILKQMFLWRSKTKGLAFRLHQFISQGGSVYATIENRTERTLTLEGQYTTTEGRLLYPLVFCRECGQDYYVVRYDADKQIIFPQLPTALDISPDDTDIMEGYLTLDEPELWDERDTDRLPDSWFTETKRNGRVVKKEYARFIPQKLRIFPDGKISDSLLPHSSSTTCWFIPKPFLTCLNCGIVHDRKRNEPLNDGEFNNLITTLINALSDAGYLSQQNSEIQLRIDSLLWKASNLSEIPPDL
jgi:hypothetical protein